MASSRYDNGRDRYESGSRSRSVGAGSRSQTRSGSGRSSARGAEGRSRSSAEGRSAGGAGSRNGGAYGSGGGSYGSGGGRRPSSRKKKAKQKRRLILFSVELIALVVLGVILWGVMKQGSMQKININEEEIITNMNEGVEENEAMKGYRNIALFGLDARDDDLKKGNRSDSIMIASINQDTGEVKLVSVYRDTYLNLSNDKYNKCNAAYAAGGPEQAILMLNMNLDLNITDYISINFNGLIEAIDSLGGVQVDVQEEEIRHLNNYQESMFSTEDQERLTTDYVKVTQPGLQTLNGMQATAYCRIRATAGDDFRRAERQRTVLLACLEKAKQASFAQLNETLDKVLPHVATNLDTAEILEVLQNVTKYNVTATDGFPFEDSRTTGRLGSGIGSIVIPIDLESNVIKLHAFLFEQEAYEPSEQVKACSAKISSDTGY